MINVSELRVGNSVLYTVPEVSQIFDDGSAVKVRGNDIKTIGIINSITKNEVSIQSYSINNSFIYPIPLTPEILEKCGFTNNNPIWPNHWDLEDITIAETNNDYELFGSEWTLGKPFKYLHQLQNLYFALTGEELEIKL